MTMGKVIIAYHARRFRLGKSEHAFDIRTHQHTWPSKEITCLGVQEFVVVREGIHHAAGDVR